MGATGSGEEGSRDAELDDRLHAIMEEQEDQDLLRLKKGGVPSDGRQPLDGAMLAPSSDRRAG